jgi:hypothetical protein
MSLACMFVLITTTIPPAIRTRSFKGPRAKSVPAPGLTASPTLRVRKGSPWAHTNRSKRDSCRPIFKQLQILTSPGQYVYSLLMFVNKSRECFYLILTFMVGIRVNLNLHLPTTNLKLVQKGVYYSAIKIFNHLPTEIKSLFEVPKHLKIEVRSFLPEHTLYSLEDYYRITPNETYYTNTSQC